jgi:DNA-binding transcriptional ArsR family regulator
MDNIDRWEELDDLVNDFKGFSTISPSLMSALAERMEEAIAASSREPGAVLSDQLSALFIRLVQAAPARAVQAVRGELPPDSAEHAAFMIGQIEYAQMFAAQISNHIVSDTFTLVLRDARYQPLVHALYEREELSSTKLAEAIGETTSGVSRKLAILRDEGICYFRKEGTMRIYFLTPAALAAYSEYQSEQPVSTDGTASYPEAMAVLNKVALGGVFGALVNFGGANAANDPALRSLVTAPLSRVASA